MFAARLWCTDLRRLAPSSPRTPTHTRRLLTGCYHLLAPARTSLRPPGFWRLVGGRAGFLAAPGALHPVHRPVCSQSPLLSLGGLFYRVSVTAAPCLSLQIANTCPSPSRWVTCHHGEEGGWDYVACNRITSEMLAAVRRWKTQRPPRITHDAESLSLLSRQICTFRNDRDLPKVKLIRVFKGNHKPNGWLSPPPRVCTTFSG